MAEPLKPQITGVPQASLSSLKEPEEFSIVISNNIAAGGGAADETNTEVGSVEDESRSAFIDKVFVTFHPNATYETKASCIIEAVVTIRGFPILTVSHFFESSALESTEIDETWSDWFDLVNPIPVQKADQISYTMNYKNKLGTDFDGNALTSITLKGMQQR